MKRPLQILLILTIAAALCLFAWRLVKRMLPQPPETPAWRVESPGEFRPVATAGVPAAEEPAADLADGAQVEMMASSKPQQIILRFPSDESYRTFFAVLGRSNVRLLDRLDRLQAVRLGYENREDLLDLLDGARLTAYNALPTMPDRSGPGGGIQPGAVPFDDSLLTWLGVTGDHSAWGRGVKVAVLDTGVIPHPALPAEIESIEIVPFPDDLSAAHGHGTAVASLIVGNHRFVHGLAPAAELVSIRISDESGVTDSFAIAQGILEAIDAGAHLINLSLGAAEPSPLLEDAVELARQAGIVIVAAAGNEGLDRAAYPAAYPGVISVGSVDVRREHLEFSNYGDYLYMTAPGYLIHAAWPGDRLVKISGTSASAPVVTGAIAAVMSHGAAAPMSAAQAVELLTAMADDAGIPGPDSEYGVGILNIRRVMNRATAGIVDLAITHQRLVGIDPDHGTAEVEVTIQNRGTTMLVNALLEVATPDGTRMFNSSTLAPGAIQSFTVPVRRDPAAPSAVRVRSRASFANGNADLTPDDNLRTDDLAWE